jgi:cysteinyl-tRNA synthetase
VAKPLLIPLEIKRLADLRQEARTAKDWTEADRLRDDLKTRGWEMQDGVDGYRLERL